MTIIMYQKRAEGLGSARMGVISIALNYQSLRCSLSNYKYNT